MTVLIDYDLITKEIRRIVVPENDSELIHHPPQPGHGWGRVTTPSVSLTFDILTGNVALGRSSLPRAAAAVQAATGVWPPNVDVE